MKLRYVALCLALSIALAAFSALAAGTNTPAVRGKTTVLGVADAGQYPTPIEGGLLYDPIFGSVVASDGGTWAAASSGSGAAISYLEGTFTALQSTNLAVGDHLKFNSVQVSSGSLISLDTTTAYTTTANVASLGRLTLTSGHTYEIIFSVGFAAFSGANTYVHLQIYDSDTPVGVGQVTQVTPSTGTFDSFGNGVLIQFITPSVDTRYEIRITTVFNLLQFGQVSTGNHFPTFIVRNLN